MFGRLVHRPSFSSRRQVLASRREQPIQEAAPSVKPGEECSQARNIFGSTTMGLLCRRHGHDASRHRPVRPFRRSRRRMRGSPVYSDRADERPLHREWDRFHIGVGLPRARIGLRVRRHVPDAGRFLQRRAVLLVLGDLNSSESRENGAEVRRSTKAGSRQAEGGAVPFRWPAPTLSCLHKHSVVARTRATPLGRQRMISPLAHEATAPFDSTIPRLDTLLPRCVDCG